MNELAVFMPVKSEITLVIPTLKAITKIEDDHGAMIATNGLKSLTGMLSAAESIRKSAKQPHIDAGKLIDEHHKQFTFEAINVQSHLKRVLLDWNQLLTKKKEAERRALEEAKRIEDEKRIAEMARNVTPPDDDFAALLKPDNQLKREIIVKEEAIKTEQYVADKKHESAIKQVEAQKVKGVRKVWTFIVESPSVVPAEFLIVDESLIRKAVLGGAREIPGVRIFEEERMAARS